MPVVRQCAMTSFPLTLCSLLVLCAAKCSLFSEVWGGFEAACLAVQNMCSSLRMGIVTTFLLGFSSWSGWRSSWFSCPWFPWGISRPTPKPPDLRVHLVSLTTEPPLFQLGVVSRVSVTTDREYLPFTVTNQSDSPVFVESNPVLGSACLLGTAKKAEVCAAASVSDGLAQPPKVRDMFDWTECAAMSQQQARSVSCCACTTCHFSAMRPLASVPYLMVLVPSPMAPSPHHLPMLMMMPHPFVAPSRVPQRRRGPPAKPAPHLPSWKKRRHLERKKGGSPDAVRSRQGADGYRSRSVAEGGGGAPEKRVAWKT